MADFAELLQGCKRGILFSGPLIPPVLDGRKTVTRRMDRRWLKSPAGTLLYVCETIRRAPDTVATYGISGVYRADGAVYACDGSPCPLGAWVWRRDVLPSLHMPRALSRCVLRLTEAPSLERLDAITEDDAKREGVTPFTYDPEGDCWTARRDVHRSAFEYLWGELHGWVGPESFAENPEVVRLAFELAGKAE